MLRRVVDAWKYLLMERGSKQSRAKRRVEVKAHGLTFVHEPLQTGLKAVDSLVPPGRGQ